jgi:hypothetical protein
LKKDADSVRERDTAKPAPHYLAYIARMEKQVELAVKGDNPGAFVPAGDYCLRMGRAAYSAGKPVKDCRVYLKRSADYQIRFYAEGVQSKLTGLWAIDEYLEAFSAAYLVRNADEVIAAFERVKPDHMHPWDRALMGSLVGVLLGLPIPSDEEGEAAAARMKEYASLPGLFHAVQRRDIPAFTESLETYATKSWGPPADRVAKKALNQPYPDYSGKWSFFSAAMCSVMGSVPSLSKKALQYVPVDLVAR